MKIDRKNKTISYTDPFDDKPRSFSYGNIRKTISTIRNRKTNLRKAAASETRAYYNKMRMTPTQSAFNATQYKIYNRIKGK